MSEKDRTRRISPMFGFLALIVAFGALVLVTDQPAAADTFTSINTLVGAVTLGHFTSLNLTTSGNTLTLGINLAHSNHWSITQYFGSSSNGIDLGLTIGDTLCFDSSTCTGATPSEMFSTGGGILTIDSGDVGNGNNPCKLLIRTNDIARLEFQTTACAAQGSSPLTTFESIVPGADNTLDVGTPALRFTLVRAVTITSGDFNFWPNPCGIQTALTTSGQPIISNPTGCNSSPLYTLTEDLTGKGLIFENHVTGQNQTIAMLNADGSPTPQFDQAVAKANAANGSASIQTVTVTTTTTKTIMGP